MNPSFEWPSGKSAAAIITVDMDAESGVLHTHPETASQLDVMAHQSYDVRTGIYRLLRIFAERSVRATAFVPGFAIDRWPDTVRDIVSEGHELGHHGYLHEYLNGIDRDAEEDILLRGIDSIARITGRPPIGYRAPGFKVNRWTPELLDKHGFLYDSSLQDLDIPYSLAIAPESAAPAIIELPVQWMLDDFAYYVHLPRIRPGLGIESPKKVFEIWQAELDALVAEGGCFNLTLHPFLSGRASRSRMVDDMIQYMQSIDGLWIAQAVEVARHAKSVKTVRIWNRPIDPDGAGKASPV
ncbi:MAG: polysaccharide deacetylase [Parvibaculaceae bacterium]